MIKNCMNLRLCKAGQNETSAWLVSFIAFWFINISSGPAFADAASTAGAVVCNISTNLKPYADFITAVAYVVGAFLLGNGILMLKRHSEGVNGATVSGGVLRLIAGSGSLSLPTFAGLVQASVVGISSANGTTSCTPGAVAALDSGGQLDVIFTNLITNIRDPMQTALSVLCVIMGVFMIAKGLLRASKYGTDQKATIPNIAVSLIVGAILISAGQMMDVMVASVTGGLAKENAANFGGINWSKFTGDSSTDYTVMNNVVKAVLTFVQIIGMIAFIRGWMIIKTAVEGGQGTIAQGATHIIGGAMSINIHAMLEIFNRTFGLDVLN